MMFFKLTILSSCFALYEVQIQMFEGPTFVASLLSVSGSICFNLSLYVSDYDQKVKESSNSLYVMNANNLRSSKNEDQIF